MSPVAATPAVRNIGVDVLAGRVLAWCCHPVVAWRCGSRKRRAVMLTGYFAAGYIMTLLVLQFPSL